MKIRGGIYEKVRNDHYHTAHVSRSACFFLQNKTMYKGHAGGSTGSLQATWGLFQKPHEAHTPTPRPVFLVDCEIKKRIGMGER
jgi:hypothetical protein